jgi:hypothetical protein
MLDDTLLRPMKRLLIVLGFSAMLAGCATQALSHTCTSRTMSPMDGTLVCTGTLVDYSSRSINYGRRERPLSEFTNGQFRAAAVLYRKPESV